VSNTLLEPKAKRQRRHARRTYTKRTRCRNSNAVGYRCAICYAQARLSHRGGWCDACRDQLERWGRVWSKLRMLPACPAAQVEERIALYAVRAEKQLDLFEPPVLLPIHD
jgi:hypothetical protein